MSDEKKYYQLTGADMVEAMNFADNALRQAQVELAQATANGETERAEAANEVIQGNQQYINDILTAKIGGMSIFDFDSLEWTEEADEWDRERVRQMTDSHGCEIVLEKPRMRDRRVFYSELSGTGQLIVISRLAGMTKQDLSEAPIGVWQYLNLQILDFLPTQIRTSLLAS